MTTRYRITTTHIAVYVCDRLIDGDIPVASFVSIAEAKAWIKSCR